MAITMTNDGNIIIDTNPVISKSAAGIVRLAYNQVEVNEQNIVQEIQKMLDSQYSVKTDSYGNFAGRVTMTLEILCDYTRKGEQAMTTPCGGEEG